MHDRRMSCTTRGSRRGAPAILTAVVLAIALWAAVPHLAHVTSAVAAAAGDQDARVAFTLKDTRVSESSGLATSRVHPGIVYTHNDSEGSARFFAIGEKGRTLATYTVAGAQARDWEAVAVGPGPAGEPAIYLADIGDNLGGAWPSISVYRLPEPRQLHDAVVQADRLRFTYADGPRNAEALLVHPGTGRVYIASKEDRGSLYVAPENPSTTETNTLRRVAPAPSRVTGGAFAPDGDSFVLRTYFSAHLYTAPGEQVARLPLPLQPQGESVAYTSNGRALLVSSEGAHTEVWRVPLPGKSPNASPEPEGTATTKAAPGGSPANTTNIAFVLIAIAVTVLAAGLWRRRRRG